MENTKNNVLNRFKNKIEEERLILYVDEKGMQHTIEVDNFIIRFQGANLSKESLLNHKNAVGMWKVYIDELLN